MKNLRRRRLWPAAIAILVVLIVLDSYRRPADQVTAAAYVATVHVYQAVGRPLVKPYCTCRYLPSCSEYSVEAVQTHGIRYGLYLTAKRLFSCNSNVSAGNVGPGAAAGRSAVTSVRRYRPKRISSMPPAAMIQQTTRAAAETIAPTADRAPAAASGHRQAHHADHQTGQAQDHPRRRPPAECQAQHAENHGNGADAARPRGA